MQTVLTRILSAANSLDKALVSASPAARVTVVGMDLARGCLAPMLVMLMMRPPPCLRMWPIARRARRIAPKSLRSKSACQVSSVTDSNTPVAEVPALLTRISMRPKASIAPATTRAQSSARLTSACIGATLPPAATICAATASSNSRPRATMTTLAPSAANITAVALPIPWVPPVTMATFPFRFNCMIFPCCRACALWLIGCLRRALDYTARRSASKPCCISAIRSSTCSSPACTRKQGPV